MTYLQTIQFIIPNYELDSFLVPNQLRNPNHLSAKIYFRKNGNMSNKKCHDCKKPISTENRTEVRLPVKAFVCEDCARLQSQNLRQKNQTAQSKLQFHAPFQNMKV